MELQAGYLSSYSPTQNCNGKIHLAAAIGLALVENGQRVLLMRTGELVQRLQIIADRCQSALRRVGQGVPRPGHDLAAIDRLMHYATILEVNVESHWVFVGRAEIGAAWSKRSSEGRDYLSVKLDIRASPRRSTPTSSMTKAARSSA